MMTHDLDQRDAAYRDAAECGCQVRESRVGTDIDGVGMNTNRYRVVHTPICPRWTPADEDYPTISEDDDNEMDDDL